MKQSILVFLKCFLTIFIYTTVFVLTGLLSKAVFGVELLSVNIESNRIMTGLITTAIIQSLILVVLASRSRLKGIRLGIFIGLVLFSINELLNLMEGLVFLSNIYPIEAQLVNLLNGALLSSVMGFSIAFLWGSKNNPKTNENLMVFKWSPKIILPWIGWILVWIIIYIIAGMLIPMNADGVYDYYYGQNGAMDMSLVPVGFFLQIPRASIWILLAIALFKYLEGTDFEKAFITALTFGGIMSSALLIPNFIMPDIVRLSHLPEILFANLLWGFIISWNVGRYFIKK